MRAHVERPRGLPIGDVCAATGNKTPPRPTQNTGTASTPIRYSRPGPALSGNAELFTPECAVGELRSHRRDGPRRLSMLGHPREGRHRSIGGHSNLDKTLDRCATAESRSHRACGALGRKRVHKSHVGVSHAAGWEKQWSADGGAAYDELLRRDPELADQRKDAVSFGVDCMLEPMDP